MIYDKKTMAARATRTLAAACVMAAMTMATSCLKDQEDYFDRPASERLQETMDRVRQILRESEHGWELEYYPSSSLAYGGIVYTVKFDSLTATVGCSLIPDSFETTYYRMTNDNGPVLTFDTYNHLLHYFSTPSSGEYEAKGGEFELVVDDISDSLITLYGKKTRNTMYLRKLRYAPSEYAENTVRIFDNFVSAFTGTIGQAETKGTFNLKDKSMTVVSGTDTTTMHYTYNDRGIRLYRPLTIGGVAVQEFAFDTEAATLTCLDRGHEDIVLQGVKTDDDKMAYKDYEGNYNLRYNGSSSYKRVRLKPNRLDGTYRMQNLVANGDLVLNYDYDTGYLTLGPQIIGETDGATVYFLTYSSTTGTVWIGSEASMTLQWNGNKSRIAYSVVATNPRLYDCDSAIIYAISFDDEGNTQASPVTDSGWMVNNSAMIPNITTLQKLKN